MIRKPAGDWGRESAAVAAARTVATTGTAAIKTGVRTLRGAFLCGFGGLWMFGALGSLASGSVAGLVGCGAVGGALIFFGVRLLKGESGAPETAPAGFAVDRGAMAVDYSRAALTKYCIFGALALAAALWGASHLHGPKQFIASLLIPIFGVIVAMAARKAVGDLTALRWDSHGLTATGLWGRRTAPWSQVESVRLEQVNSYALYGLMKVGSAQSLKVSFANGSPRKLSLSSALLDLQDRSPEGLAATLQAAQGGGLARPAPRPAAGAAPAFGVGAAPPRRTAPPQRAPEGFEPADAAIARYKADQARSQPTPLPATGPAPAYLGAGPARTTFGRRGV